MTDPSTPAGPHEDSDTPRDGSTPEETGTPGQPVESHSPTGPQFNVPDNDFEYRPTTQATPTVSQSPAADGSSPAPVAATPAPMPSRAAGTPGPVAEPVTQPVAEPAPETVTTAEEESEPAPAPASAPLTERYVAVTLGLVPVAQREFAEPALRAAIEDEIEHRHDQLLGEEGITKSDIEVDVLEEMGDPEQVAAAMTHRPKVLVGARFYVDYKRILLWALAMVIPVSAALAMVSTAQENAELRPMIEHGLAVALTAAVYAAMWVTLGFAIAERVARHRSEVSSADWTIDRLPTPARTVISTSQTAFAVVMSLVVATAIILQQLDPSLFSDQGEPVTFLNPDHWPLAWSAVVVLLGINALVAIGRHVRGYWAMRAAFGNLALLTGIYGLLAWMLVDHSLLNDAFFDQVGWPSDNLPPAQMEDWAAIAMAVFWFIGVTLGFVHAFRARAKS
ncbi:hypothetical protein [Demequina aurantiaca]|uniref:hypothetical protein n=1 Tax=Demequina aurantiaca TaxID=676200 RepID=UPI000780452E|nr:hypothetical protein [Demequina aurantiaca]